jgi:hypothetical protein
MAYFSVYFVLTQLALLAVVYVFMRVDWKVVLQKRKWRWLPKSTPNIKRSSSGDWRLTFSQQNRPLDLIA